MPVRYNIFHKIRDISNGPRYHRIIQKLGRCHEPALAGLDRGVNYRTVRTYEIPKVRRRQEKIASGDLLPVTLEITVWI